MPEVTVDRAKMADREFAGKTGSRESRDLRGPRVWRAYKGALDHLVHAENQASQDHRENQAPTGNKEMQGKTEKWEHQALQVPRDRLVLGEQPDQEVNRVSRDWPEQQVHRERWENQENAA